MNPPVTPDTLVVISLYEPRGLQALHNLTESMSRFDAGAAHDTVVVVNRTGAHPFRVGEHAVPLRVIERPNTGMNIGAWDHGWRTMPGYRYYLFLQDECFIKDSNWLLQFIQADGQAPGGLLGESYNQGWNKPWGRMRQAQRDIRMREHTLDGQPANRVDVYLEFMRRNGIEAGKDAGHLRSLIWFTTGSTLATVNGFPIGANYGECIAAEIATSKRIQAAGLPVRQVSGEPFVRIGHLEWQRVAGKWRHVPMHNEVTTPTHQVAAQPGNYSGLQEDVMAAGNKRLETAEDGRIATRYVDHLLDEDLKVLNDLLPWQCFTLDANGRQFGKAASDKKRNEFQPIPDPRIAELNERFPLQGKRVLEVGCFEGVHSLGLASFGAEVTAIDSRIENVVKTIVRTWSFGFNVTAFKCDVEREDDFNLVSEYDAVHHVGVLYHLVDPVAHMKALMPRVGQTFMLDTHYAKEDQADLSYESGGVSYRYRNYKEGGRENAFAGMYDHAKWLTLETLVELLKEGGFADVDVAQLRDERNGPRTLIFAKR